MGSLPRTYEIRNDVIWPSDLLKATPPPALVYLDMLGYVNLAKAADGTALPAYNDLLDACRQFRADGRALFPLSSTHVMEVYDIGTRLTLTAMAGGGYDGGGVVATPTAEPMAAAVTAVTAAPGALPPAALVSPPWWTAAAAARVAVLPAAS